MIKEKSKNDFISEEEYTNQMDFISTRPEDDSPGDSEADAGAEFLMGLSIEPKEDSDTSEDLQLADDNPSPTETENPRPFIQLPATAQVVSSEVPEPWLDSQTDSDTH